MKVSCWINEAEAVTGWNQTRQLSQIAVNTEGEPFARGSRFLHYLRRQPYGSLWLPLQRGLTDAAPRSADNRQFRLKADHHLGAMFHGYAPFSSAKRWSHCCISEAICHGAAWGINGVRQGILKGRSSQLKFLYNRLFVRIHEPNKHRAAEIGWCILIIWCEAGWCLPLHIVMIEGSFLDYLSWCKERDQYLGFLIFAETGSRAIYQTIDTTWIGTFCIGWVQGNTYNIFL